MAIATLSACRWKMSSVSPASSAIAHRRLLPEEMRGGNGGARAMPCAPLVDDQLHAMPPIDLRHHVPVIRDEGLHPVRFVQELVPLVRRELNGVPLAGIPVGCRTATDVPRVVMQGEAPDIS